MPLPITVDIPTNAKENDYLLKQVCMLIERQNWSDEPLTEKEQNLIALAMGSTIMALQRSEYPEGI